MRIKSIAFYAFLLLFFCLFINSTDARDKKYRGENDFVAVDSPPVMVFEATPAYPDSANANKIEGIVWIKALVDENGKVIEAKALKCSAMGYGFEEAALEAARKCEYTPAKQKEKPVSVWVTYKVEFALAEGYKEGK
jgi:protein TonB